MERANSLRSSLGGELNINLELKTRTMITRSAARRSQIEQPGNEKNRR